MNNNMINLLNSLHNEYSKIDKNQLSFSDMLIIDKNMAMILTYMEILPEIGSDKISILEKNLQTIQRDMKVFNTKKSL